MTRAEKPGLPSNPSGHSRPSSCLDSLACQLPEPVIVAQLAEAVQTVCAAGAAAKQATAVAVVAVAVGASGRVWAWRLPSATGTAEARGHGQRMLGRDSEGDQNDKIRRVKRKLEAAQELRAEQLCPWPSDSLAATEQCIPLRPPLFLSPSGGRGPTPPAAVLAASSSPAIPSLRVRSGLLAASSSSSCSMLAAEAAAAGSFAVRGVEEPRLRAQLAAQVAWEYLDALWQDGMMPGLDQAAFDTVAIPIPLPASAARTVPGQSQPQLPLLHSVATWAASGSLPADACCACYVALPAAAQGSFLGSARTTSRPSSPNQIATTTSGGGATGEGMDWEPHQGTAQAEPGLAAAGGAAARVAAAPRSGTLQALGLLLVGTQSGEVAAFPVGTPAADSDAAGRGHSYRTAGAAVQGLVRAVAVVHGSCLHLVWLPPLSQQQHQQQQQQQQQIEQPQQHPSMPAGRAQGCDEPASVPRLVLHAASGRLVPAPPDPCSRVLIAGGSTVMRTAVDPPGEDRGGGSSSSGAGHAQRELGGLVVATIHILGSVDSVSVDGDGHLLFYTCSGQLHCLDCSSLQQHLPGSDSSPSSTAALPRAIHLATPIEPLLVAAAADPKDLLVAAGNEGSEKGAEAASGRESAAAGACRLVLLSREGLLLGMLCPAGAVAGEVERRRQSSATFEELEQQMQGLLSKVADLSTAQQHLSHELLQQDSHIASLATTLPAVQSINCGPAAGLYCSVRPVYRLGTVLGAAPDQAAGMAVEVSVHNGGHWALPAGHSMVVAFSATTNSSVIRSSTPSSGKRMGCSQGMLHVLLCHHSSSKAGTAHAALLHSVAIDALHFTTPGPLPSLRPGPPFFPQQQQQHSWQRQQHLQRQQITYGTWSALREPQLGEGSSGPREARLRLLLPAWLFSRRPDAGAALQALLSQGLSSLDLSPASPASSTPSTALAAALQAGRVGAGGRTAHTAGGAATDNDGAPARDRSHTQKQHRWQQEERAARLARAQQLAAVQLGAGAVQAPRGAGPSLGAAGSVNSNAPGAAWWEPLLSQQRRAAAASHNPLAAFAPHSSTSGAASRALQLETAASHPAVVCAEFSSPAALSSAVFPGRAPPGTPAAMEVSARLMPAGGPMGGASWQHADLEVTARTAGPAEAALEGHAALLRRVIAMQGSLPDRDPPIGLRFSSSALLAPQQGATSPVQSAMEGADESALEGVLCTLRQLKSAAMRLRDEALHAQHAQHVLQGQQSEAAPPLPTEPTSADNGSAQPPLPPGEDDGSAAAPPLPDGQEPPMPELPPEEDEDPLIVAQRRREAEELAKQQAAEFKPFDPLIDAALKEFYGELRDVDRDNEVNRILGAFKLNPYEQMGLKFDATYEEIRRHYRKVSLMVHPDKCKHPRAKDAFEIIGAAQKDLLDEERRKGLDYVLGVAKEEVKKEWKKAAKHDAAVRLASVLHEEGKQGVAAEYEASDEFAEKWKVKARDLLARTEWRRRKLTKRIEDETERAKEEHKKDKEQAKRQRDHEKEWETTREGRVGTWRDFMTKKSKKSKGGSLALGGYKPPRNLQTDDDKRYIKRPVGEQFRPPPPKGQGPKQ
ncbi:hypothetical protein N2152v2_003625 [Parachlorella kessleri]